MGAGISCPSSFCDIFGLLSVGSLCKCVFLVRGRAWDHIAGWRLSGEVFYQGAFSVKNVTGSWFYHEFPSHINGVRASVVPRAPASSSSQLPLCFQGFLLCSQQSVLAKYLQNKLVCRTHLDLRCIHLLHLCYLFPFQRLGAIPP